MSIKYVDPKKHEFEINMRQQYLEAIKKKSEDKHIRLEEEKRERERIEQEWEELRTQGYQELFQENKTVRQQPGTQDQQNNNLVYEPKRLNVKQFSPSPNQSKLQYLERALSYTATKEKQSSPLKFHDYHNNYKPVESQFSGRLDNSLIRLRNEINNGYSNLNNRLHLIRFKAQQEKENKDSNLRDYDRAINNIKSRSFGYQPKYSRKTESNNSYKDTSFEKSYFSKIGSSQFSHPYNQSSTKNHFAVVSKPLSLESSFDPRTHEEIGLKGKYEYYKFACDENRKPDPFDLSFDDYVDSANISMAEIDQINNSSMMYNNKQRRNTNRKYNKIKKLPNTFMAIRNQNKREVRFKNGLSDVPAQILDGNLSFKDEEKAEKLLQNPRYVDIDEINKKFNIEDTEIEQLDGLLNSLN